MRIAIISNMFPTSRNPAGGIFVERRVQALRRNGHVVDPFALVPLLADEPPGRPLENSTSWRTIELPWGRRSRALAAVTGRSVIAQSAIQSLTQAFVEVPDVVVGHGSFRPSAAALAVAVARHIDRPSAAVTHGSDLNAVGRLGGLGVRAHLNSADARIFVSEALRSTAYQRGVSERNSYVLPNGIDPSIFHMDGREVGVDKFRVAFIGNLVHVKGADRLPEIFMKVQSFLPSVEFVVIGDGGLRAQLKSAFADFGVRNVSMLGAVTQYEVGDCLRNVNALVLPSRSEGWPCVVLEAHACGAAVVGFDVGGVAEAIGDPSCVVSGSPAKTQHLAERLVEVLQRQVDTEAARRAMNYTWERLALREAELYATL